MILRGADSRSEVVPSSSAEGRGLSVANKAYALLVQLLLDVSLALQSHQVVEFEAPCLQVPDFIHLLLIALEYLLDACFELLEFDLKIASLFRELLPAQLHVLLRSRNELVTRN